MAHGSGLRNVLAAFNQHGAHVISRGGYYVVQCPAHDDRTASLSVTQGEKGAVLNCHAGCETDAIRIELNLPWKDLFDQDGDEGGHRRRADPDLWMPCQGEKRKPSDPEPCSGHKAAEYRYVDEKGTLLYAVARCSRKGDGCPQPFAQWHPDSSKKFGKKWGLPSSIRRVLYDLPRVLEAARNGQRIWLMEGEKDADRMKADFPGEVATTAPSGAGKSKWRPEFSRFFVGAAEVIIVADCDNPGLLYAEEVHHHISKVVEKVTAVHTPLLENGADFSDHRNYGFGLDEFEVLPFEKVERRPRMVIQVEEQHREKPVVFDGFSQEAVERYLLGSMLKYGMHYDISEADVRSNDRLRITAGAISRIAARGSVITPETVAVEIEAEGKGSYDNALSFLIKLEESAFSDAEKPKMAARILRERSVREGIVYSCRATEEAAQNERLDVSEVLEHMRRLTERHTEEYAQLAHDLCDPVGDVFTTDVVEQVAAQEGIGTNVRALRPAMPARQAMAQRG